MADPLTYLKQRSGDDWLVGYDSQAFFAMTERVLGELRSRSQPDRPLTILLAERDPLTFLAHFIAACAANCCIVLANSDWAPAEWQQVFELFVLDVVWGERAIDHWRTAEAQRPRDTTRGSSHSRLPTLDSRLPIPRILIPTGGTSGNIRFAIHTWETLMASVDGFCQYFEVKQVNSFCVLPLYHVSGLMQFLRSFTTGGRLVVMPFRAVEAGDHGSINPQDFFLSLVPTQLQRLLDGKGAEGQTAETQRCRETAFTQHSTLNTQHASVAWLACFDTVLLGGAPAWADLLDRARSDRIRLAPTYGMTETASQIATLKPDDFLNGQTNSGKVLPHSQITIRNASGDILAAHQIGNVTIQAKSLAWGYYSRLPGESYCSRMTIKATHPLTDILSPCQISYSGGLGELGPQAAGDEVFSMTLCQGKYFGRGEVPRTQSLNEAEMSAHRSLEGSEQYFQADDLGFFDTNGYLHIVGRHSDKIITGGENVFPAEVEAAIRSTNLVQDVCVLGIDDRHWGQAIAAVYVPIHADILSTMIQIALEDKLCKFKRPKHWLAVDRLPRNAQGKVNRSQIEAIANDRLSSIPAID